MTFPNGCKLFVGGSSTGAPKDGADAGARTDCTASSRSGVGFHSNPTNQPAVARRRAFCCLVCCHTARRICTAAHPTRDPLRHAASRRATSPSRVATGGGTHQRFLPPSVATRLGEVACAPLRAHDGGGLSSAHNSRHWTEFGGKPLFEFGGNSTTNSNPIQPLAPKIWGKQWSRIGGGICGRIIGRMKRGHVPLWLLRDLPALIGIALELLAADDHGDQQRSQSHARKADRPQRLRRIMHMLPIAEAHLHYALCRQAWRALGWNVREVKLEILPTDHQLVRRRQTLRILPQPDDGPARSLHALHRRPPRDLPHPHTRRCERRARGPWFDGRASRCSP